MFVYFLTIFISFSSNISANEKNVTSIGTYYYKNIFGHIHQNPLKTSNAITTVACAHPLKVTAEINSNGEEWLKVKIGDQEGYVLKKYTQAKRSECFQDKYPKFFNALNLDLTELYYWGRLYDQYSSGISKIK